MAVTCNPFSLFNWFLLTFDHLQQYFRLVSHRSGFCAYERSDLSINYFLSVQNGFVGPESKGGGSQAGHGVGI